jgi:A/G-specific adenine glycosylase
VTFANTLLAWYLVHKRDLPWRNTGNPYFIWLSEVILQQTRVEQGLPYYLRFVKTFPTVRKLASAREEQVLKLWQGLGYYSRARNLHHAAKEIVKKHKGIFPTSYDDIRALKGVGDYTAAAIASFAFNLPMQPWMETSTVCLAGTWASGRPYILPGQGRNLRKQPGS